RPRDRRGVRRTRRRVTVGGDGGGIDAPCWPCRTTGAVGLVVVAMFLAGMAVGGVLSHDSQLEQLSPQEARTAISFLNGVPPTTR
ncbi:MAG: hypothetical protein WCF86_21990, partial [Pseudolabrys sp.]